MSTCRAPGCERDATAKGLCLMHYKRVRAGKPLTTPEPGTRSGFGRYGLMDEDGDRMLCHECGDWYASVGSHLRVHGLSATEYRDRHGIPRGRALTAAAASAKHRANSTAQVGTPGWKRLEAARDPAAAAAARDPGVMSAAARRRVVEHGPQVMPREVIVCVCEACGVEWCPLMARHARVTCSPECVRVLASRKTTEVMAGVSAGLAARDAAIVAAVERGEARSTVGKRYRLTEHRVGQIVRAARGKKRVRKKRAPP